MERAEMVLQKNAENGTNKIRIPKNVIKKMGNKFYMEIYNDKIVLKPVERR